MPGLPRPAGRGRRRFHRLDDCHRRIRAVSGYALVRNNGVVQDNAIVTDHAIIELSAQVQGNAVVEQYARMGDNAVIKDQAIARGDSYLWGSAVVSGYAIADYDYSMNYAISNGTQFNHIPFDSYFNAYYASTQTKPRGLIASYDVSETSGDELWDQFGALEAWLAVRQVDRPIHSLAAARCFL